jgi:creatinine amidohydrolase/Fe(II)-dependent formamide hydrolase-like protein
MRRPTLHLFLVALLAASATALAAPPSSAVPASPEPRASLYLEDLTSPELAAAIRAGKTTILVPIGGTEQNGPHMVLGKHNVRAKVLAGRIAQELGNAVVAPVVAYVPEGGVNPPTGHMRYPGTITVPADAYRKVLESAARSFRLAGFRDIVFLGDSGSYQKDNELVARQLDREWAGASVRVYAIAEYYRAATDGFARTLRQQGYGDAEIGVHAGLADTSLAMAVDPGLVRPDQQQSRPMASVPPGVSGDPRRATAELGQPGIDMIVTQSVAAIRAAVARR